MPYETRKLKSGKVRVSGPSGVHAKATTPVKAKRQLSLLRAVEHGWQSTSKKRRTKGGRAKRNPLTLQGAKRRRAP